MNQCWMQSEGILQDTKITKLLVKNLTEGIALFWLPSSCFAFTNSTKALKEVVFVDSTSHVDQLNCYLMVMVCPSATGALPLAMLLTSGQSKQDYTEAFKLLQQTLGQESFFHQGYPSAFMTDDSEAKRGTLASIWPASKEFLCIFHILQAMWRWLWNAKNEVKLCDRKPLMKA